MSWWAEKINAGAPPAPVPQQAAVALPGGRAAVRNVYPGAQTPVAPQAPTPQPVAQDGVTVNDDGTVGVLDAAEHWNTGPGMKEVAAYGTCPECGSVNFFSRTNTEGSSRLGTYGIMTADGRKAPPAPHCYECGYNGQYDLAGGSVVQGQGQTPAKAASQIAVARPTFEIIGRVG